jgi:hypothetical protein
MVVALVHARLMAATLVHRTGEMTEFAGAADLDGLILELDGPADPEHPDVAVAAESGWTLSAFGTGLVVFENVECEVPARHQKGLTRAEVRDLFRLLVRGDVQRIESLGWVPGYGS